MHFQIRRSKLQGSLTIPPSKSHTLRAILFASLADGESTIINYLVSPDTNAMLNACMAIGAEITITPNVLKIKGTAGKILKAPSVIDAGNSGIVLRFMAAIAALHTQPIEITGDHSIQNNRPLKPLLDALNQLHVEAVSINNNDHAPARITGPFKGGEAQINGEDSQPVSALIIASCFSDGPTTIHVDTPGETPWIDLTLSWLDRLNIPYSRQNYTTYHLPGRAIPKAFSYAVPGDWSSAAFPIVAALITHSSLTIHNVDFSDIQGDKAIIPILQEMGATINIDQPNHLIHVSPSQNLVGKTIDVNEIIDAIPILAVLGCFTEGQTRLINGAIARKKESDRLHSIALELNKMGADVEELPDGLLIHPKPLQGALVQTHSDHRIAMALAIAAMNANDATKIQEITCINKTYPSFFNDFHLLGANIERVLE